MVLPAPIAKHKIGRMRSISIVVMTPEKYMVGLNAYGSHNLITKSMSSNEYIIEILTDHLSR